MKKTLFLGLIFIIIGFFLGDYIFSDKSKILKYMNNNKYYFIQEGVYSNKTNLKNSLVNLDSKVVEYTSGKYHIYIGISKDLEVAKKIQRIYTSYGINTYIKEKIIKSNDFKTNIREFDSLITDAKDEEEILTIEEVVLANYQKINKNSTRS